MMNERIKRLAMNERIRTFMEGYFDITVDSHGREVCTADYINVQEFADIIIMECAELSVNYPGNVKLLILNHFGIEPYKEPEHIDSETCWCKPELDYTDPDTGVSVYVHRRVQ